MPVPKVNVFECDLDEPLDEAGFRHVAASIGGRLGAVRIGAGVYEAVAGRAIWPYHYHYSSEEWLYVISGEPLLRDPAGRRALRSGDLVCFPSNHRGAHTLFGPGRFVIFSSNESSGPWVAVYPDSDKLGLAPGRHESTALNALRLPRSGAVDYWHGEGTAGAPQSQPQSQPEREPHLIEREPVDGAALPVINTSSLPGGMPASDAPAGSRCRTAALGPRLGGGALNATVCELDPGGGSAPYRYEYGREEWVLVLSGAPTLRHPGGEEPLTAGDVVCFPEGPGGARRLLNRGDRLARVLFLSTLGLPANVCYPDSGTWVLGNGPPEATVTLREAGASDAPPR